MQVTGKPFNPLLTVSLYKLDATFCMMFKDAGCDRFTEMRKLFSVS